MWRKLFKHVLTFIYMAQKNLAYSNFMRILSLILIAMAFIGILLGLILTLTGTSKYLEQYLSKTQVLWFVGIYLGICLIVFIISKIKKVDKTSHIKIGK